MSMFLWFMSPFERVLGFWKNWWLFQVGVAWRTALYWVLYWCSPHVSRFGKPNRERSVPIASACSLAGFHSLHSLFTLKARLTASPYSATKPHQSFENNRPKNPPLTKVKHNVFLVFFTIVAWRTFFWAFFHWEKNVPILLQRSAAARWGAPVFTKLCDWLFSTDARIARCVKLLFLLQ